MKKLKYLLLVFLLIPVTGHAAVYHCSAPGSVESGQSFSVTFSGSLSSSNATWSGKIGSEGNARFSGGDLNIWVDGASFSRTINYVAGNPGTASFYVYDVDVSDENQEYSGSDTCTVTITEASQSYSNNNGGGGGSSYTYEEKSGNNYLKSISAENVTLSQVFDKEVLEYKGVVSGDVEKTNIQAELEDDRGWIEGLGEKDLVEGVNRFEIKVHAQNDEERVYVIEITRKEKNPIEVIIDKKRYTVFKKEGNLEPPKGFVKTTVVIEKQDVVAYSNKYIDYILVLLVDELGDPSFYIYNSKNSTYVKYNEVSAKDSRLVIIKANRNDIPINYRKTKLKINNEEVEAYYLKGNNDFKLVYAINMDNGDESFYQYDIKEKTFQRYNKKLVSSVEDFSKKLEVGLVAAVALILILIIILIAQASSKKKMKKVLKNKKENEVIEKITKKEEKKEIPKEEKKEEPKKVEDNKEKELSKKELKRLQKEEKKKQKEEQKEFLK